MRELNVIRKRGKPETVKVALAYPSTYEVAVSSLAYQMLYYYINSWREYIAERFSTENLRGHHPLPISIETGTPMKKFDIIVFSVHYEPDYVNILRLLLAAEIPPYAADRKGKPIVIAGGPAVISNPEPIAKFLDVAVIGEIETTMPIILENFLESRDNPQDFLDSLSPAQGFYIPARGTEEKVKMSYAPKLEKRFHPTAQIQPLDREPAWGRGTLVEVSRGCFRGCAFCLEGHIFSYYRERPLKDIVEIAVEGSLFNQTKRIITVSLSFFDHSKAKEILGQLIDEGLEVSIPSLRAETLDEEALQLIYEAGQRSLTIAPETASRELALKLRKIVPEDKVLEVARKARKVGFRSLKLYFMIGIPGETIQDVEAIAAYVEKISAETGFKGTSQLKITISPLVPKPHTPLERASMEDLATIRRKIQLIKRRLAGKAEVREYDPRRARIQAIISRGGRELAETLLAWAKAGAGLGGWRKAVKQTELQEKKYISGEVDTTTWSFIVLPLKPSILRT